MCAFTYTIRFRILGLQSKSWIHNECRQVHFNSICNILCNFKTIVYSIWRLWRDSLNMTLHFVWDVVAHWQIRHLSPERSQVRIPWHSSRHVRTLGKSFTRSCLKRFDTCSVNASREFLWVVLDLKRRYRNCLNEWMNKCLISITVAH